MTYLKEYSEKSTVYKSIRWYILSKGIFPTDSADIADLLFCMFNIKLMPTNEKNH